MKNNHENDFILQIGQPQGIAPTNHHLTWGQSLVVAPYQIIILLVG